jgi:hypothetical protein
MEEVSVAGNDDDGGIVKLLPLPQPHLCADTYAQTYTSTQRDTYLKSVLACVYSFSIQNLNTNTGP